MVTKGFVTVTRRWRGLLLVLCLLLNLTVLFVQLRLHRYQVFQLHTTQVIIIQHSLNPQNVTMETRHLTEVNISANSGHIKPFNFSYHFHQKMSIRSKKTKKNPAHMFKTVSAPEIPALDFLHVKQLDNPKNFFKPSATDVIHEPEGCHGNELLLIGVCSAVSRFQLREAIRKTWGTVGQYRHLVVRVVFFLGIPDSPDIHLQQTLLEESRKYGDIVQMSFVDSYKNLSLKTLGFFLWMQINCPNARFVMKTDDDVFINVPNLLYDMHKMIGQDNAIMGHMIKGAKPITDRKHRWYMPQELYKAPTYPPYLSGTGYIMPYKLMTRIHQRSQEVELFWLEDIFITGILAKMENANLIDNPKFVYQKGKLKNICLYRDVIVQHDMSPEDLIQAWTSLQKSDIVCSQTKLHVSGQSLS